MSDPRPVDRKRWAASVEKHLEDFPRQIHALEYAMGRFGQDFDLAQFKGAFKATTPIDLYSKVQAVERSAGRVQNYAETLAIDGSKLANLDPAANQGPVAVRAFHTIRDNGVISRPLCRRLERAHRGRNLLEHGYIELSADETHRTVNLIWTSSLEFIGPYRAWIEPLLLSSARSR